MIKNIFIKNLCVVLVLLISSLSLMAQEDQLKNYQKKRYIGKEDAPVTMYNFASLACPFCAEFEKAHMAKIKENLVDKGLLKVVFMDVPIAAASDANSFAHALLYKTKNNDDFFKLLDIYLVSQDSWRNKSNSLNIVKNLAKRSGLVSDADIKDVEKNQKLYSQYLEEESRNSIKTLNVKGTPSAIIIKSNEKLKPGVRVISGANMNYSYIAKTVDSLK